MGHEREILRILDAGGNRAREALRVLEDYARFVLDDGALTEELKGMRHELAGALALLPMGEALEQRDTPGDVGTGIKTAAEMRRETVGDVLTANGKRLSEALRSLEEMAKTVDAGAAARLERLRYRGYTAEKMLVLRDRRAQGQARFGAVRLYVLLTEELCVGKRGGWEGVLEEILVAAGSGSDGRASALAIQLREKGLGDGELLRRAGIVARRCREAGAMSIVNDRADIAVLAGADGVHVGQTDLPVQKVRKVLPAGMVVGVSTEDVGQARAGVAAGADYVAVGPMFPTTTKVKPRVAGPGYAAEALGVLGEVPCVAIGGITPENVGELRAVGIRRVAVSAAVLRAADVGAAVRRLLETLRA